MAVKALHEEMVQTSTRPRFAGVLVAASTPFGPDGALDLAAHEQHCSHLAEGGVTGIVPVGSLGEYEALTDDERAQVVKSAVDSVGDRVEVVPGVSAKSAREAQRWAEHAAQAGCRGVMCLPPTSHAPTADEVVAHFAEVARVGLPIIAYNNPFSTRVDLTPSLLARLAEIEQVVAVKEFSQDIRRVAAVRQAAPRLEVICGSDDTFVEAMFMGATAWISGFANAFPRQSVELYELCRESRWAEAKERYMAFLPLLRWDADPRFVQAVKIAQEEVGWYGGPVRLPRLPLPLAEADEVRDAVRRFLKAT
ncbi:MAG TPA: dihydrodipicolinate synthase family protein [Acidimicrobiales bacterium]|nr:dihydrodipicolinate synthase family protein [Acidimicrobiales bacterium]